MKKVIFCFIGLFFVSCSISFASQFDEVKGKHFIVQYSTDVSRSWAQSVLREAENYYSKIANQIGYRRYQDYWTWENRAKIIIYKDQPTLVKQTGVPAWSKAGSVSLHRSSIGRAIVTFKQEEGFLTGVLPHEISHLILQDFIGQGRQIPIWFNEGVAQLQENTKKETANRVMRLMVKKGKYIPFAKMFRYDVRFEIDPYAVAIFYAQSVSVIDFLIKVYGTHDFGQLCKNMRDGKSFEDALVKAYTSIIQSTSDLESKWLSFMKN